jgi:uncharacterized membrane protein
MTSRSALGEPPGIMAQMLDLTVLSLEVLGVAAIVLGAIWAGGVFARDLARKASEGAYRRLRSNLGRGILLGLELLVGADIIATVTAPLTLNSVGLLGLVVLIRTFLSFSLETEIEGRWPWRRNAGRAAPAHERQSAATKDGV